MPDLGLPEKLYDDTETRLTASAVAALRSEMLKLRESTLGLRSISQANRERWERYERHEQQNRQDPWGD